jgi:TM2 domain-containing membrane protein YozV
MARPPEQAAARRASPSAAGPLADRCVPGRIGQGIVYLVFFWTFIPAVIGFIDDIWYLTMTDREFWARYPDR